MTPEGGVPATPIGATTAPRRRTVRALFESGSGVGLATHRTTVLAGGILYLAGGAVGFLAMATAAFADADRRAMVALAMLSLLFGVAFLLLGARVPFMALHLATVLGTFQVAAYVVVAGGGVASVALTTFWVWLVVYSAFAYDWRVAGAHITLAVLVCVATCSGIEGLGVGVGLLMGSLIAGVGATVAFLVRTAADADVDPLTGLLNRRGFERRLDDALVAAEDSGELCVALFDVDHFKRLNDEHGHHAGDRLLREMAAAWSDRLHSRHVLSRFGGDEFALLLGESLARSVEIVESLRGAVPVGRSCSAGITDLRPGDTGSMLIGRADTSLYRAKRTGRDRLVTDDDEHWDVEAFRRAMEAGEFSLYQQAIVELSTGRLVGVECLARWHHAAGLIPPDRFIPAAERNGTIVQLGRWVLRRAASTHGEGRDGVGMVSVNVSTRELSSEGYADSVLEVLHDSGLAPDRLVLEITEGALDLHAVGVHSTLEALRRHGVRVAIDDFGTGYSALSRLDRLPVDIIKVDRSFVSGIEDEHDAPPLLVAVLAMAEALGVDVIAEGIEQPAQAVALQRLGCELGQGHLFDHAAPARVIT